MFKYKLKINNLSLIVFVLEIMLYPHRYNDHLYFYKSINYLCY